MLDPMLKTSTPVFLPGDTVQLNEPGKKSAKLRDRTGVIVAPSKVPGKFRILWNGLKRTQLVQAAALRLAETQQPAEPNGSQEDKVTEIGDELEKLRSARFERHLGMPRQMPYQIYEPERARTPHRHSRRVLDYLLAGVLGLTAASIAISQCH